MNLKRAIIAGVLFFSTGVHATTINYTNDVNNDVFWTNNDLGLDIMRLSYSDTINQDGHASTEQANLATIESFLMQDTTGWQWATDQQFLDIYAWFDTDPDGTGYTEEQNQGSSLFFELNGTGSAYDTYDNGGYYLDGYGIWRALSKTDSVDGTGNMRYFLMQDYADGISGAVCTHATRCNQGYHNGPYYNSVRTRTEADLYVNPNRAALLVRGASNSQVSVPEPQSLGIFALSLLGLGFIRRKANTKYL